MLSSAKKARLIRNQLFVGLVVAVAYMIVLLVLFPRIGIRDSDAYAYATCARSLATIGKYETLDHVPMTTWPPGYSATLALFPDRLAAARYINFSAAAIAVFMIFALFVRSGWNTIAAAGWATVLGCGFLSTIATNCSPDAINVAGFYLVVWLGLYSNRWGFLAAILISPALIVMKYVAVVYAPALASEKLLQLRGSLEKKRSWIVLGLLGFFLSVAVAFGLSYWNKHMSGQLISPAHSETSRENAIQDAIAFVRSPFRAIVSNWNGPVGERTGLAFYAAGLVLAGICFFSLRWNPVGWGSGGRLGLIAMSGMLVLRLIRAYTFGAARLSGPALILCLLAFKPKSQVCWPWLLYAVALLIGLIVNVQIYQHDAGNDQRYVDVAQDIAKQLRATTPQHGIVATNFSPLLDVHEGIATRIVEPSGVKTGEIYLHVIMPNYPPVASVVTPIDFDFASTDWETVRSTTEYVLYRRR